MKKLSFFAFCLLSGVSILSCTPEERADLIKQISGDDVGGASSGGQANESFVVKTGGASSITETSAVLSGTLSLDLWGGDFSFGILCATDVNPSVENSIKMTSSQLDANNGYSISFLDLFPQTTYYYRAYLKQNGIYRVGEVKYFSTLASSFANCYIVSSPGTYSFKTVKGNSSTSVGSVFTAEVLWESFGTATEPVKGDIIRDVSYAPSNNSFPGTISYIAPSPLKNGNAVIAAKDINGKILWSWHIWVCKDYDPEATAQEYFNNAGTMMDRNLGATSATPGDVGALGLLYQWGRKDPFLGRSSIHFDKWGGGLSAASTITWPSRVYSDSSTGTIDYAIENPTTLIQPKEFGDWLFGENIITRWQTTKTIYDPCPPGWRVPEDIWGTAAGLSWTYGQSFQHQYNCTDEGFNLSGIFGPAPTIWYPASGHIGSGDGRHFFGYWSSHVVNSPMAASLRLNTSGYLNYFDTDQFYRCVSVRCQKE